MRKRAAVAQRDTVDAVAAGFALQATVLVSGVLAARLLGPENRGLLALVWIITVALSQLGTLGVPAAVAVFLARDPGRGAALVAACRKRAALQAVVVLAIEAGVLWLVFSGARRPALAAALAALAVPPAMIGQLYGLAILQGLGHLRAMQILRVLPTAAYTLVLLAGLLADRRSLEFVVAAWTGGYVASAALTGVVIARLVRALPDDDGRTDAGSGLTGFGLRAMLGSVSPLETFRIDQLLVGLVLSAHALGLYVAALAFTNLPRFISQGIGQVAVVRIAPLRDAGEVRRSVRSYTLVATLAALVIAGPLAALAEPLVSVFFGASFAGAAPMMQVLQVATVLVCVRRVLGDCLRGAGHPGPGSVAELCSYVALVPALVAAALGDQAIGVAWALVVSAAMSLLVLLVLAWRRVGQPVHPTAVAAAAGGQP